MAVAFSLQTCIPVKVSALCTRHLYQTVTCVFLDGEQVLESNWPIYLVSLFMTFFFLVSPFVRAITLVSIMV